MDKNANNIDLGVIILAAGKGTRMKSGLAKVLHPVGSRSMILHVVEQALKVTPENVYVVVGHQAEAVKEEISHWYEVGFAYQERLLGTGDAVKAAVPYLSLKIRDVLVLCGDVPLIRAKTLRELVARHKDSRSDITVLATEVDEPKGYGRIVLDDDGGLVCIREELDASLEEKRIQKINTGIYCFNRDFLVSALERLTPENSQKEYYLTDVIEIARQSKKKLSVVTVQDARQVVGVNTLEDLEKVAQMLPKLAENELP